MLIPLAEYAKLHKKSQSAARRMALRGGFETAKKMGRDWMIEESEAWPDHRVKTGRYKKADDRTPAKNTKAPSGR